jgi:amino acid permease
MTSLGLPELILVLALFVWIALLIWVHRDAKRRGMNAVLWVMVVFFLHLLGFIAYLIARGMRSSS